MAIKDHLELVDQLMPIGMAWEEDAQQKYLCAFGFAHSQDTIEAFSRDYDPRATSLMLTDWERVLGLPDTCVPALSSTDSRRAAVVSRLTESHTPTVAHIKSILLSAGFDAQITEASGPHTVSSYVSDPLFSQEWVFVFFVKVPSFSFEKATVISDVSSFLGSSKDLQSLICLVRRIKPAHTQALFI